MMGLLWYIFSELFYSFLIICTSSAKSEETQNLSQKQFNIYKYKFVSSDNNFDNYQNYHQLEEVTRSEDGQFDKTIFIIPVTGVLLVITMVVLYVIYTWNLLKIDESQTEEIREQNADEIDEYFNFDGSRNNENGSSTIVADEPPSYSEVIGRKGSIQPPTYSEVNHTNS